MSLSVMQIFQIKKFALLDTTPKINNVVYNLRKIVFYCTAILNPGMYSVFSFSFAFEPKIVKFSVKLNITYIFISFV